MYSNKYTYGSGIPFKYSLLKLESQPLRSQTNLFRTESQNIFKEFFLPTPPFIRSMSSNSASSGTAISVAMPAGTVAGDDVYIFIHGNGQTTITDNNGGTAFAKDVNDFKPNTSYGHTVSTFYRRIQVGDPTTYNFTLGATGRWSIVAVTLLSANSTTFLDTATVTSNLEADGSTFDAPSITTVSNGALHLAMACLDDGVITVSGFPTGYTDTKAVGNQPMGVASKIITTAGATGAQTFTFSGVSARIGISVAIRPASAGAGGNVTVSPTTQSVVFSTVSATVTGDSLVAVTTQSAVFSTVTCTVGIGTTIVVNTLSSVFTTIASTVTTGATVTPTTQSAVWSLIASTVLLDCVVQASTQNLTWSSISVTTVTGAVVQPGTVSAVFSAISPTVVASSDTVVTVSTQTATFSVISYTVSVAVSVTATPTTQALVFSVVSYTVSTTVGVIVTPFTQNCALSVIPVTIVIVQSVTVTSTVFVASFSVPTASVLITVPEVITGTGRDIDFEDSYIGVSSRTSKPSLLESELGKPSLTDNDGNRPVLSASRGDRPRL